MAPKRSVKQSTQVHQEEPAADVLADPVEVAEEAEQQQLEETGTSASTIVPKKKRVRQSKKEIRTVKFSDNEEMEIREFIKSHPELYDKRNKYYQNPVYKQDLWKDLAQQLGEICTGDEIRKYYHAKRTDFGKIEIKSQKSGSSGRVLTMRQQQMLEDWSFLKDHISHERTMASSFEQEHSDVSSEESAHSAYSIMRRHEQQQKKKRPRSRTETPEEPRSTQSEMTAAMGAILENFKTLTERRSLASVTTAMFDYVAHRFENVPITYQIPFTETIIRTTHALLGDENDDAVYKRIMARGLTEDMARKLEEDQLAEAARRVQVQASRPASNISQYSHQSQHSLQAYSYSHMQQSPVQVPPSQPSPNFPEMLQSTSDLTTQESEYIHFNTDLVTPNVDRPEYHDN